MNYEKDYEEVSSRVKNDEDIRRRMHMVLRKPFFQEEIYKLRQLINSPFWRALNEVP